MSNWEISGFDRHEVFYRRKVKKLRQSEVEALLRKLYLQTLPNHEVAESLLDDDASLMLTQLKQHDGVLHIGSNPYFTAKRDES